MSAFSRFDETGTLLPIFLVCCLIYNIIDGENEIECYGERIAFYGNESDSDARLPVSSFFSFFL